ncbi:MAG: T9SS type A sorting domain-containing protein [Bacteroidales bacterium]|nr:T9SS type A sorting domain-containing protein [Bacteroidales bacterium]
MKKSINSLILGLLFVTTSLSFKAQTNVAGNALYYDGSSILNFGSIDFGFTDELTIMVWVKWDTIPSSTNNWANILTMNSVNSSDDGIFWLQHNSDNSKFEFALTAGGSRSFIQSSTIVEKDIWYHIAATYDGVKMRLYINGELEAERSKTGSVRTPSYYHYLTMGAWAYNSSRLFTGTIDEISVWTRTLSVDEILEKKNYNLKEDETNLAGYWMLDEISGQTIFDNSNSEFNGEISSSMSIDTARRVQSDAPIYSMPLPISLISFDVEFINNVVVLEWATASETNNDYFTLYRSNNAKDWIPVAYIKGMGNSTNQINYSYFDEEEFNKVVYYKLRQTDFDGRFEEFEIKSVRKEISNLDFSIYPNPCNDNAIITLDFEDSNNEEILIEIFDMSGKRLFVSGNTLFNDGNFTINTTDFSPGKYIIILYKNSQSEPEKHILVKY